jgi:uncharacterized membrane protein YgcG
MVLMVLAPPSRLTYRAHDSDLIQHIHGRNLSIRDVVTISHAGQLLIDTFDFVTVLAREVAREALEHWLESSDYRFGDEVCDIVLRKKEWGGSSGGGYGGGSGGGGGGGFVDLWWQWCWRRLRRW